jgi:hypothetical protein
MDPGIKCSKNRKILEYPLKDFLFGNCFSLSLSGG